MIEEVDPETGELTLETIAELVRGMGFEPYISRCPDIVYREVVHVAIKEYRKWLMRQIEVAPIRELREGRIGCHDTSATDEAFRGKVLRMLREAQMISERRLR